MLSVSKKASYKMYTAYLIHPHSQWVPIGDQKPLANIKLGVIYQQRSFYSVFKIYSNSTYGGQDFTNVFLDDPFALSHLYRIGYHSQDVVKAIHT